MPLIQKLIRASKLRDRYSMKSLKTVRLRITHFSSALFLSLSRSRPVSYLKTTFVYRLYKSFILDSIFIVRNRGFKQLLREKGLKFFVIICLYYLIRDSILYIIIPFLIAKGLLN
jgi:hypothetical protein